MPVDNFDNQHLPLAFLKAFIHHQNALHRPIAILFLVSKTFSFIIHNSEKKKRAKLTFRDFLGKADLALSPEQGLNIFVHTQIGNANSTIVTLNLNPI